MNTTQIILKKLSELQFNTDFVNIPEDITDGNYHEIYSGTIEPEEAGKMAPLFKSISYKIYAGIHNYLQENNIHIKIEYSYKHRYGSNGYTCNFTYSNRNQLTGAISKTKKWYQTN